MKDKLRDEKWRSENSGSGQFGKIIHGQGGAPSGPDQKQNSDAICCLYTDVGLQIPKWEHLLEKATRQISRQLGSRCICAKNMGPPGAGTLREGERAVLGMILS